MADATALIERAHECESVANRMEATIKSAEVLVVGGLSSVVYGTGKVENGDDTAALIPTGYVLGSTVGDNSTAGLTGNATGDQKVMTSAARMLKDVTVTGVATIADLFKLVYATDNQTLTLTAPTVGLPIGYVKEHVSTTTCHVQLFTLSESLMWGFIPRKETIYLGALMSQAMQGTEAADLLKYTCRKHMTIDTLHAYPNGFDNAAVAGSHTLNLEIGATNTTGGVLTLAFGSCDAEGDLGTKISATAITALNEASMGDVLTLETAGGTGFTADAVAGFNVYMDVTYLPGA